MRDVRARRAGSIDIRSTARAGPDHVARAASAIGDAVVVAAWTARGDIGEASEAFARTAAVVGRGVGAYA